MAYNFDDETLKYYTQKLKEKLAEKDEIPTKTSDLTNDNGFITIDEVPKTDLTDYQTKSDATLTTTNKTVVGAINELEADSHTHTNEDILDAITSEKITSWNNKAEVSNIPTKTSDLTNDSGFLTSIPSEYITETELDNKGYLTEHQDISGKADKSYVDTELAKKSDKTHTHSYNDLSDKPVIPSIDGLATKKELTDGLATKSDTGHTHDQYLTEHQDLSDYALKTELPSVPTKTSQLTNDSGFITSIPSEYITETELNAKGYLTSIPSEYITETELNSKGYLTQHQDISGKVDKVEGKGLSTNDYTTEEKNKLNGIEENANNYSLPIASSNTLGGIKVGSGLSIDSNGVLSSSGGSSDLSNYQTKTDNALTTTDKTIVGAINELNIECIKSEDYENTSITIDDNLTSRVSTLETNKANKSEIPTTLPANGGNSDTVSGISIWVGTQSEYDSITNKSSTTLYFIREV